MSAGTSELLGIRDFSHRGGVQSHRGGPDSAVGLLNTEGFLKEMCIWGSPIDQDWLRAGVSAQHENSHTGRSRK